MNKIHLLVAAGGQVFVRTSSDGSPITHYETVKLENISQLSSQQIKVCTGENAINFIDSAHGGANSGFNCRFKWRKIHFKLSPLIDNGVLIKFFRFTLVVGKILHRCDDFVALNALYHRAYKLGG